MGAGFSQSAMGAPGDWKLERLKHHHTNHPCSVTVHSWLNSEWCLIAISATPEFIARRPTPKDVPVRLSSVFPEGRNPFGKGKNKGDRKGGLTPLCPRDRGACAMALNMHDVPEDGNRSFKVDGNTSQESIRSH